MKSIAIKLSNHVCSTGYRWHALHAYGNDSVLRGLITAFLLLVAKASWATTVAPLPLSQMVQDASEIAVAVNESIYGRKADGTKMFSGTFRTGPGLGNVLVSRMRIVRVLRGRGFKVGDAYDLDFWPMWHMSTDLAVSSDRYPVILMFKNLNDKLVPVFPPEPWIDSRLEQDVLKLMNE